MPPLLSYPGVYVQEAPSGVRTITGVPTSITAFVGRALAGPVNEPTLINSFADFERIFGGLAADSTLSYAVRDFYANGGSQAVIVRLINGAMAAALDLPTGAAAPNDKLSLVAASEGSWGNNLSAAVDYKTVDPANANLFNLSVMEADPATKQVLGTERFLNVSIDRKDPLYLARVLEDGSSLVYVKRKGDGTWPDLTRPAETAAGKPVTATAGSGKDGDPLGAAQYSGGTTEAAKTGIYALDKTDLFSLLCIPPPVRDGDTPSQVWQDALNFLVNYQRRALLIVDPPVSWSTDPATAANTVAAHLGDLNLATPDAKNAALYFPHVLAADPLRANQLDAFVPCGVIAGVMARTDTTRGVWKAPAGLDASLNGTQGLAVNLTDAQNGQLNPLGVNCLRSFPVYGRVVWGARTLRGADQFADDYKYIPVRRLALYIEESLYRGTQWVVFEPNDEPLWAQIRLNIGAFMHDLFRKGAFQGTTPSQAYFVKCDKETTTQNDINLGIVNIVVGFAPLKPAEFVVITIQQIAGDIQT